MIIHYVVLTCPKHSDRRESVEKTWLTSQSFTFLSNQYGTPEGYDNVSLKYISYFKDFSNIKHNVDWYYFADDDAHVYPQKLENYLSGLDCTSSIAAGYHLRRKLDKSKLHGDISSTNLEGIDYLAGGPGFAVSLPAMLKLFLYLLNHPNPPWYRFGDLSFGFWFRDVGVRLIYFDEHLYGTANAKFVNHNLEQIKRRYAYHYIPPHKQKLMHALRL